MKTKLTGAVEDFEKDKAQERRKTVTFRGYKAARISVRSLHFFIASHLRHHPRLTHSNHSSTTQNEEGNSDL